MYQMDNDKETLQKSINILYKWWTWSCNTELDRCCIALEHFLAHRRVLQNLLLWLNQVSVHQQGHPSPLCFLATETKCWYLVWFSPAIDIYCFKSGLNVERLGVRARNRNKSVSIKVPISRTTMRVIFISCRQPQRILLGHTPFRFSF